jgi:thiopeptide-type bacteriocin biosynthesis protein
MSALVEGVDILARAASVRIAGPLVRSRPEIARFISGFAERYGVGEWIPLGEALDDESGLGFRGAWSPAGPQAEPIPATSHSLREAAWDRKLLRLVHDASAQGRQFITLGEDDLADISAPLDRPIAHGSVAVVTVAAPSQRDVDEGNFNVVILGCGGPSSTYVFGRFCNGDETLTEFVKQLARHEDSEIPDATFAEVVHLPNGRMGNIIARPVIRDFEILYIGSGGAPRENQVDLADLLVTVTGERVTLWSKRLGVEIVPCLSSAHAAEQQTQLPVYRFFQMLRSHSVTTQLEWSWGALHELSFLPRVVAGRAVLSPARWFLTRRDLAGLTKARGDAVFDRVSELRMRLGLPRWVVLHAAQNELPIDLESAISVACLARELRRQRQATLIEMLPTPESRVATGPDGAYAHEIVVALQSNGKPIAHPKPIPPTNKAKHFRGSSPGSNWLYVKLYAGFATGDRILSEIVDPVLRSFRGRPEYSSSFFIRYTDPHPHIRLRVHGAPRFLLQEVLPAVHEVAGRWLEAGLLSKIQLDTYVPETSRYGGNFGVTIAERLFDADSACALRVLADLADPSDVRARRLVAVQGIDHLLDDFGMSLTARADLMRHVSSSFALKEFRSGTAAAAALRGLAPTYRSDRVVLDSLLGRRDGVAGFEPFRKSFNARSESLRDVVNDLGVAEREGRLTRPIAELLPSYIHMHVNRVLRGDQRNEEIVAYDGLSRTYASYLARERAGQSTTS